MYVEWCPSGAAESKGKTTWTGRAEKEDYVSFAGFVTYYLQYLQAHDEAAVMSPVTSTITAGQDLSNPVASSPGRGSTPQFRLLLAGYSYGSLMLSRLPSVTAIIERFQSAECGTAAAEIILRAKRLAQETHETMQASQTPISPRGRQLAPEDAAGVHHTHGKPSPVTVGGEETDPSERRKSRDSRRSADIVRKGAEVPHRIKAHIRRQSSSVKTGPTHQSPNSLIDSGQAPRVSPSYLLVSPLLPPVSHALCPPSSISSLLGKAKPDPSTGVGKLDRPTLAIWGAADSFTSNRKLRTWAEKLSSESASDFEWAQIEGAGHFWREAGVMQELQQRIAAWLKAS